MLIALLPDRDASHSLSLLRGKAIFGELLQPAVTGPLRGWPCWPTTWLTDVLSRTKPFRSTYSDIKIEEDIGLPRTAACNSSPPGGVYAWFVVAGVQQAGKGSASALSSSLPRRSCASPAGRVDTGTGRRRPLRGMTSRWLILGPWQRRTAANFDPPRDEHLGTMTQTFQGGPLSTRQTAVAVAASHRGGDASHTPYNNSVCCPRATERRNAADDAWLCSCLLAYHVRASVGKGWAGVAMPPRVRVRQNAMHVIQHAQRQHWCRAHGSSVEGWQASSSVAHVPTAKETTAFSFSARPPLLRVTVILHYRIAGPSWLSRHILCARAA